MSKQTSALWINAAALVADVQTFGPIINSLVGLVPGAAGTALTNLLSVIENPTTIDDIVAAINDIDGATPPALTPTPPTRK